MSEIFRISAIVLPSAKRRAQAEPRGYVLCGLLLVVWSGSREQGRRTSPAPRRRRQYADRPSFAETLLYRLTAGVRKQPQYGISNTTKMSHNLKKSDDRNNIIIVGGGAVGITLAPCKRPLSTLVSYNKLFVDGTGTFVVEGKVATIQRSKGRLNSKKEAAPLWRMARPSRSVLGLLAFPETKDDALPFVEGVRKRIKDANDIVLAGGGPAAMGTILSPIDPLTTLSELAGEIKDTYPGLRRAQNKNATIVQSGHLLNAQRRVSAEISVKKKARSGTTIPADVIFRVSTNTRGGRPNTESIRSFGPDVLTPEGQPYNWNLAAYDDIFAGGDILDVKEQKQHAKALTCTLGVRDAQCHTPPVLGTGH
ncbi:hypothetical protein PLEOSDRAFT_170086 [Pleurotus ostreatus PC15]|uniref:FAD/NAD(P)-binding domain-containing protein n=1 Tax=Pleurotus ostreatus (strain PC15) TaxID=1137138 RepID=A0A067NLL7_PLEO1|nr:hypothetical protein PLEOSDRAFT_170086 [Pleurotus ostreatus PC15]